VIELLLFWTCCLTAVAGAIGAATVRNLFHAALLLGLCLSGVAGLYLFLEAAYLACIQVIVYIGGVLVLVLFATLFSADIMGRTQRPVWWLRLLGIVGGALAAVVAVRLLQVVLQHGRDLAARRNDSGAVPDLFGGSQDAIGDLLIGPWLVPFLLAGVLLTVALVSAVATVQRFRRPVERARG